MKSFKMFLEGEVIQFPTKKNPEPSYVQLKPDAKHFDKWHSDAVGHDDGSSITATQAYEHYCEHAERHNTKPADYQQFNRHMVDKGYSTMKLGGRARYVGVKLNYEHDE